MNQKEINDIRIYGTLVNHTVDNEIGENVTGDKHQHNAALAYAKLLYDDKFGEPIATNNFQDVINKRVKDALADILNRLAALESKQSLWKANGEYLEPATSANKVKGAGFFDTTVS